jgi:hypothetical protein
MMARLLVLGLGVLVATVVACTGIPYAGQGRRGHVTAAHRFDTVGIYVLPPAAGQEHYLDFYRACGYNYLEFCDTGFSHRPARLPGYYAAFAGSIAEAQEKGFRVWVLLLAGMKQWEGDADTGSAGTFGALDRALLNERLTFLRQTVRALKNADGFQFFAGDPGGDPQGRATIADCAAFARDVRQIVREEAPDAGFAVNLWAIAEWAGFPSPFTLEFWQKQVELSKAAVGQSDLLGPDCGVLFSMDNLYRSLTLRCHADAGKRPEPYPQSSDIEALRRRRVKPIYGWPYFVVDECDDGFITPNNVVTRGQAGAETRYIRAIVDHGLRLRLDGLVANASFVAAEPLNIFAFARMCRDPKLGPEHVLDDFAALVADDATKASLARVLRFIENHGNWQNSLPAEYRLPDMPVGGLPDPDAALTLLESVRPRARSPIPLPEAPAAYLARLRQRLLTIKAGEIGGPSPHFRAKD